jgi:hypothetical protein
VAMTRSSMVRVDVSKKHYCKQANYIYPQPLYPQPLTPQLRLFPNYAARSECTTLHPLVCPYYWDG